MIYNKLPPHAGLEFVCYYEIQNIIFYNVAD